MMRKVLGWTVLAFLLFYAISNPTGSAHIVHTVVSGIGAFASALAGGGR